MVVRTIVIHGLIRANQMMRGEELDKGGHSQKTDMSVNQSARNIRTGVNVSLRVIPTVDSLLLCKYYNEHLYFSLV